MTDSKNVVIGVLVAALVYDGVVGKHNRKLFKKKSDRIKMLEANLRNAQRRADYFADRLDAAQVPVTAFDRIVADLTDPE